MSSSLIGSIILWLIVAVVVIVVAVYLLNWLYHRSTKEIAFVRTGFGGETVVINGGSLVLKGIAGIGISNIEWIQLKYKD